MRLTTYAYPWDLARRGVARSLAELAAAGMDAVDVASTYHPIDAVSPQAGTRLFTLPRGAVLFPARPERYGPVKPYTAGAEVGTAWSEVAAEAPTAGLDVNAWTVSLFQPWIVDQHPGLARVLPNGDAVSSGPCASNEAVQDYVATLCADLADQFDLTTIRLEGISVPAYDYGWGRPRVLFPVPKLARELLSICFCDACTARGIAAGLDVRHVRQVVIDAITAELADAAAPDAGVTLAADPDLHAFVVQHERTAGEIARAARAAIAGPRAPKLATGLTTPFRTLLGDDQLDLLSEAAASVDELSASPLASDERTQHVLALAASTGASLQLGTLLVPVQFDASATSSTPKTLERIESELAAAAAKGIHEVSIYGWGLLRDEDYRAVADAARRTRA